MNMKRKSLAILVCLCFILTIFMGGAPATYLAEQNLPTDISGHWAKGTIITMLNNGVIGGYPDGTFQPNRSITRAEFTTIANKAFGTFNADAEANFTDVKTSDWYYNQVASGKNAGFISGFPDGSFQPNNVITREQAAAILANLVQLPGKEGAIQFRDADKVSAWARQSVKAVTDANVICGYPDGTFKPLQPVTRAETVVIVQRALELEKTPAEPITPSSLEVSVTANGKAVDKATVNIFADGKYEVLKTGTTDSKGIFRLELAKGTYNITVVKGKQVGFADKVSVKDKGQTPAAIKLTEGVEIQGKLLDNKNNAIKNVEIVFTTTPIFISKTDSAGQFRIVLLPNNKYTVLAFNPDKKSEGLKTIAADVVIGSKDEAIKDLIAPFTIATSTAGGGGGGGGGSAVNQASVSTAAELASALNNSRITSITFTKDIAASPTVTRSLTIDFGAYALTGDLMFRHNGSGTSVLKGNAGPRIIGDLTVDTPNASFKNGVTVLGKVNIANVSPNSWTEAAAGNTLTITVPGGATITVTGSPNSVTVTEDAGGNLILTVSPGAVIDSITTNAPVNIQVAAGATVNEISVEEGADGTVITNDGTTGNLKVNASIELVANVAPTEVDVGSGGSIVVSGDDADKVPVVSAISITTEPVDASGLDNDAEVTVTLATATSGASVYYTLDGTTPTEGSTLYEGPFTVTAPGTSGGTVTVKAIGIKSDYTNSAVAATDIVFKEAEDEPEPQVSTYAFSYQLPGGVVAGEEVVVPVTFATDVKGDIGYDGVRFKFAAEGPGDVTFKAVDSNEVEHTFTDFGYWGPARGFELPADYAATTDWTLVFSETGEYTLTFSLIDAASEEVIAGITDSATVEVGAAPAEPEVIADPGVSPADGATVQGVQAFTFGFKSVTGNLQELELDIYLGENTGSNRNYANHLGINLPAGEQEVESWVDQLVAGYGQLDPKFHSLLAAAGYDASANEEANKTALKSNIFYAAGDNAEGTWTIRLDTAIPGEEAIEFLVTVRDDAGAQWGNNNYAAYPDKVQAFLYNVTLPESAITINAGEPTIEDGKVTLAVTTKNNGADYANARYGIKVNAAGVEGDTISVSYGEGLTFNLTRIDDSNNFIGYFGPASGFTIEEGWNVTTTFTVDFGSSAEARTVTVDAWVGPAPEPKEDDAVAEMEQVEITIPATEPEEYHTYKFNIEDKAGEYMVSEGLVEPTDADFASMTPVKLSIVVDNEKDKAYDGMVRVAPVGAENLQLWAKDTEGNWHDINVVGWGPEEGFPIDPDLVTIVYVIATGAFDSNVTVKLVDVTGDYGAPDNIIISQEVAVKAVAVTYSNYQMSIAGPTELEAGVAGEYSVRAWGDGTGNSSYTAVYDYAVTGGVGTLEYKDGEEWKALPLQGQFGPSTGFELTPDWDITTLLRFTPASGGIYGVSITLRTMEEQALATVTYQVEVVEVEVVSGSIGRDPANTGGYLDFIIADNTVTFSSGEIAWYPEDTDLGRAAGNRVGVQINAPADFNTAGVKVTIGEREYNWDEIEDSEGYFWWYPLVTQANQEFIATVVWNEVSTQVFRVVIGEGITLEPAPDTTAPALEGVTPVEGSSVNLALGETFKLTVDAYDEGGLYELEVDHSMEGTLPEFSVYADAGNPYGTAEDKTQFESFGVGVTYDAGEQKWIIDFGSTVTDQIVDNGGITFYLVIKDQAGNAWGSMYDVTDETTFVYTVTQVST